MKNLTTTSTLVSTLFIVAAATGFAGSASASEGIQDYIHIPNAAISGHNRELLRDVEPADCAEKCDSRDWCVSFDYHKENRHCDLSDASAATVGLKQDYSGNPFDYYGAPAKVIQGYTHIPNAAISGLNRKRLQDVEPEDCAQECSRHDWCVSFDYEKAIRKCDLSDASAATVGLKTNYSGNPYDYYGAPQISCGEGTELQGKVCIADASNNGNIVNESTPFADPTGGSSTNADLITVDNQCAELAAPAYEGSGVDGIVGSTIFTDLGLRSTQTFECGDDAKLVGKRELSCEIQPITDDSVTFAWNGVAPTCFKDCTEPEAPENGFVRHAFGTLEKSVAVYSCPTGTILTGAVISTCNNGEWSETAPTCETDPNSTVTHWTYQEHGPFIREGQTHATFKSATLTSDKNEVVSCLLIPSGSDGMAPGHLSCSASKIIGRVSLQNMPVQIHEIELEDAVIDQVVEYQGGNHLKYGVNLTHEKGSGYTGACPTNTIQVSKTEYAASIGREHGSPNLRFYLVLGPVDGEIYCKRQDLPSGTFWWDPAVEVVCRNPAGCD